VTRASVVIASHRPALIANAITPLLADAATLEVVVVAVDSPDVVAAVHRIGDSRIRVETASAGNPNAARQLGVERARGEIVVMLDDDVLPGPGLVNGHVAHHAEPGQIVLGYMPIPAERLRGARRFPARLYACNYEGRVEWWTEQSNRVISGFWGGNVSMTRADTLRVGLENPAFPVRYFEDREFGARCHAAGLVATFDRRLRAAHLYERSISEWLVEGRRQGAARAVLEPGSQPGAGHLPIGMRSGLVAAAVVAGGLRLRRVEGRLARAARQIELFRGAQEVAAGTALDSGLIAAPTPPAGYGVPVMAEPEALASMESDPGMFLKDLVAPLSRDVADLLGRLPGKLASSDSAGPSTGAGDR
jgi:glycosyl transferase family 2